MIQSICKDPQRQDLHSLDRFPARLALGQHSGQLRQFRQPTAVVFLFDFNGQWHNSLLQTVKRSEPVFPYAKYFGNSNAIDATEPEQE